MDIPQKTNAELIARIEELELMVQQLLLEKEQESGLNYAWTGNLGHWYWNVKTNSVTFNPLKTKNLGYEMEDLPEQVPYQFFMDKVHPEDYKPTMDAMMNHLMGKSPVYEVEYRIKAKNGDYKWYYDRGTITKRDEMGKPLFLAGIVFDITEKKTLETELKIKNQMLSEQSETDGLTQVKNHRTIIEHLKNEMAAAIYSGQPLTIVMFDVDNFKGVNDTYGHVFGDEVLIEVAKILKANIRDTDRVGRYGGEEFVIVFSNTALGEATAVSERIRQTIESFEFGHPIHLTISGGVKQFSGDRISELVHAADQNLYVAKKTGKNRIVAR